MLVSSEDASSVMALLRFYLRGAVRLAWRAGIPVLAAPTVAVAMSPDPDGTLRDFATGALASDGGMAMPVVLAAASIALAAWAVPRLTYGASSWMRHLPLGDVNYRRAVLASLVTAQLPVLSLVGLLWATTSLGRPPVLIDGTRLVGWILLALGAAHLVLPCRRRAAPLLAGLVGVAAAVSTHASLMFLSVAAFVAADRWAGPIRAVTAVPRRAAICESRLVALPYAILFRAVRGRSYSAYVLPAVVLAATALFVRNNELAPGLASRATRVGSGLALAAALAVFGRLVATTRPPWPWERSLPWSSQRRILDDAAFLLAAALPVLAVSAFVDPRVAVTLALALPLWAIRVAASIRHPADPFITAELFLFTGLVALVPASAVFYLASTPLALALAARKERRIRSSHWKSMDSVARGETQSWSGG